MEMNSGLCRSSTWSDIIPELLLTIVKLTEPHTSLLEFRLVCKNWSNIVPPPRLVYFNKYLPRVVPNCHNNGTNSLIVPTKTCILRPCGIGLIAARRGWLVGVVLSGKLGRLGLRLVHPLTRRPFEPFSGYNFPRILRNLGAVTLDERFEFRSLNVRISMLELCTDLRKVLLWCEDPSNSYSARCWVVTLNSQGHLTLCHPTNGRTRSVDRDVDDVVLRENKFWSLNREEKICCIEGGHPLSITTHGAIVLGFKSPRRKRLLVYNGDLYMVVADASYNFKVYRLDHTDEGFVSYKLEDLVGKILFVSVGACFFACSSYFSGIEGNCVVFTKDCFPMHQDGEDNRYRDDLFDGGSDGFDIGVCKYGESDNELKLISSCPEFWPPPQWIWEVNSSHSLYIGND